MKYATFVDYILNLIFWILIFKYLNLNFYCQVFNFQIYKCKYTDLNHGKT